MTLEILRGIWWTFQSWRRARRAQDEKWLNDTEAWLKDLPHHDRPPRRLNDQWRADEDEVRGGHP